MLPLYDGGMEPTEEMIEHDLDVLRLQLLGVAAKLEQTLYEMYGGNVLEGNVPHQIFVDNIYEMFGGEIAEALKITIQEGPYDG